MRHANVPCSCAYVGKACISVGVIQRVVFFAGHPSTHRLARCELGDFRRMPAVGRGQLSKRCFPVASGQAARLVAAVFCCAAGSMRFPQAIRSLDPTVRPARQRVAVPRQVPGNRRTSIPVVAAQHQPEYVSESRPAHPLRHFWCRIVRAALASREHQVIPDDGTSSPSTCRSGGAICQQGLLDLAIIAERQRRHQQGSIREPQRHGRRGNCRQPSMFPLLTRNN